MKVIIPSKYAAVVARLRDHSERFFRIKKRGGHIEMEVLTSLSFERAALGLTPREFGSFYRDVKVSGGSKKKSGDHIAFEPRRPLIVTVRFAESELSLAREAAKKAGATLREFIRFCVLSRIFMPEAGEAQDGST